jgi:alkylation response protein AidB-like acyl-CoA dehydrogenase
VDIFEHFSSYCIPLGTWQAEIERFSSPLEKSHHWPRESLQVLAKAQILAGLISRPNGGLGWTGEQQLAVYFHLSKACLTTAFVLTQWHAAIRRLESHASTEHWTAWDDSLRSGRIWTTVGISHLTTSRQHLQSPPLLATPTATGYRLNGYSPWVTGAAYSQFLVIAASTSDGQQILGIVRTNQPGIRCGTGQALLALSGSCTDQVDFDNVDIDSQDVIAGPCEQVLKLGSSGPGGLHTSILALGLAGRAIDYLIEQGEKRTDFSMPAHELQSELRKQLMTLIEFEKGATDISLDLIRHHANSLVLRSTQAALAAAKGAGFVDGHPVGRWCREALFFLVWSCPQSVVRAQLCELAGLN